MSYLRSTSQYNLKRYFNVSIIDAKQVIAWNISPAFGTSFEQNPLISPGVSQSFVFKLFPVSYLIVVFWEGFGLKLDSGLCGEPLGWHKLFGHSFRFHKRILASPSRRRGLGKGSGEGDGI